MWFHKISLSEKDQKKQNTRENFNSDVYKIENTRSNIKTYLQAF